MEPRLPVDPLNSGSRKLLVLTILGVLAAWLALPPAYLNRQAFCDLIGFCKPVVEEPTKNHPLSQPSPTVAPVPTPTPRLEPPKAESLPYVGGIWRSGGGHVYVFEQTNDSIEIYQDSPNGEQVKIGSGVVTRNGIKATITTLKERRRAALDLEFADDQNILEGSFSGTHESEKNFDLTLTREGH
jgi:hypothetical protein